MSQRQGELTPKRRRFLEAYCGRAMGNASLSAKLAGYKDAGTEGWRLLQKKEIQVAVEKRMARALKRMGVDDLVKVLEDHASANLASYIEQKDHCEACGRYAPSFNLDALNEDGLGHLLQEIRLNQKTGETTIKFQPVGPAIDKLLKVSGAYKTPEADETSLASILAQALRGSDEEPRTH